MLKAQLVQRLRDEMIMKKKRTRLHRNTATEIE